MQNEETKNLPTIDRGKYGHKNLPNKSYLVVTLTTTKVYNKLQADIADMLDAENRRIVHLESLPDFLVELNEKINVINNKHPRCKSVSPVTMSSWDWEDTRKDKISDIHLSANEGQFTITLYQIKEEHDKYEDE